jgi:hypothetical protein
LKGRIENHKSLVEYGQLRLVSQQSNTYERVLSHDDMRDLSSKVLDYVRNCKKEEQDHKREELNRREVQYQDALKWVSASSDTSDTTHERLCGERKDFPGTCEWIDEVKSVKKWLTDPTPTHPILWINGSMGAGESFPLLVILLENDWMMKHAKIVPGKSTLASHLVQKCETHQPDSLAGNSFKVTYFYCDGNNSTTQTFLTISRGLLRRQLMHIREDERFRHLIAHCCDKKNNAGQLESLTTEETAESLLRTFFEIIPDQYIIVDGLDECGKPVIKETIRMLSSVVTQQDTIEPGRLRLLIISRDLPEIKKPLITESIHADIFTIEADHNHKAIKLYADQRLKKFDRAFELSRDDRKKITFKISNMAKGAQG